MRKRSHIAALLAAACLLLLSFPALADGAVLYNGDFSFTSEEQALPAGWYFDAWYMEDGSSDYGMAAQYGQNCAYVQNIYENDARICQRVSVQPDTAYRITCKAAASGVRGDAGATISVLDTLCSSESVYDTDGFVTLALTGVTGKDQDELVLALRLGGYGALATGCAWFYDVRMEQLEAAPNGALSFAPMVYGGTAGSVESTPNAPFYVVIMAVLLCAALFLLFYKYIRQGRSSRLVDSRSRAYGIAGILLCGFLLRALLSLIFVGHSTDINCFSAWAAAMADGGPAAFYTGGMFADYPPGYMYVLWLLGLIQRGLGLAYGSAGAILLLKLPAILADLACAYLLYRLALEKQGQDGLALALLALYALHPTMAFISGGWGQIDSILTLLLALTLYCFRKDHIIAAGLVYGLAILIKPQALMAGPLLATAYLCKIWDAQKPARLKQLGKTALAVIGAFAVILLLALPFQGDQERGWLLEKYFSTAISYPYASIEAFNMAALFGGNWTSINTVPFLFSYGTWGTIGIAVSVLGAAVLYIRGRKDNDGILPLCLSLLLAGLFTLGQYMHERYIAPVLLLLLLSYVYYKDKRLLFACFWFSLTLLLNAGLAFFIVDAPELRGGLYQAMTRIGSFLTVAGFAYICYTSADIVFRGNRQPVTMAERPPAKEEEYAAAPGGACAFELPAPVDTRLRFTRKDRLYCLLLTGLYAVIALFNLGSMTAPETAWQGESAGQQITVAFEGQQQVAQYWVFGGIGLGDVLLSADGADVAAYTQTYDDMFRWAVQDTDFTAESVTLTVYSGRPNLNELAFFTPAGEQIPIASVTANGTALFDEQHTVPERTSYYNGMYFDELYHARTAYEHLHGIEPYENSHPPLGKVFIMLGIALFGMNPFGWRIIGTLFGIGMVPLLYCFGKRLFRKESYALLTAGLFAFDFMHFTQTRIATIDVYAVFFILLMYYYMYQYVCMNFYTDGLKKTLKPLALSGLFFALGAASKWICIYAGLGLAVLLFGSLVRRYIEYRRANGEQNAQVAAFSRNTIQTLLWCCVFFIAVPVAVYVASYTPYFLCENRYGLDAVWNYQNYMWSYHSGLVATHPYQSSWWQWPLTLKPMWYYFGSYEAQGMYSSITASGNPAVWWICSIGAVTAAILCAFSKMRADTGVKTAAVGVLANYLPWVLVTRCTFIYHFFATVPFILLLTVAMLYQAEQKNPKLAWIKWAWLGLCVLLFLLMYPGISGLPIPADYAAILQLLPGGELFYAA